MPEYPCEQDFRALAAKNKEAKQSKKAVLSRSAPSLSPKTYKELLAERKSHWIELDPESGVVLKLNPKDAEMALFEERVSEFTLVAKEYFEGILSDTLADHFGLSYFDSVLFKGIAQKRDSIEEAHLISGQFRDWLKAHYPMDMSVSSLNLDLKFLVNYMYMLNDGWVLFDP